jgi:uncharacterized protein YneF (UPF0154 family)
MFNRHWTEHPFLMAQRALDRALKGRPRLTALTYRTLMASKIQQAPKPHQVEVQEQERRKRQEQDRRKHQEQDRRKRQEQEAL